MAFHKCDVETSSSSIGIVSSPEWRTNHNIKMANKFFKKHGKYKYLGMRVSNENYVYEEMNSRLNTVNVCYFYFTIICFPISYLRKWKLKYTNLSFHLLFCMSVKLGFSNQKREAVDWGSLRRECWGQYLDWWEMVLQEAGKNCMKRSFIICIL